MVDQEEVKEESKSKIEDGYNPSIGIPAYLLCQLFICSSRVGCKYLYETHSNLSSSEFLFQRAVVASAFILIWINRNLWKEMVTNVERPLVC